MRKITATLVVATVVVVAVLVSTTAGRDIDAATQHFMLYYAGVFALIGLTASVLVGLVATDRIVMTPGHRVMAQAVHRAVSFGALAFLVIHIVTEILAQRSHVIDAFIPFLSPYRTFYIGLGTIASDLIVLIVVTSILRKRFTAHGRAWRWRAIHYTSYVAFVFGVLHGLLGGRTAKPYVDWSYGFAIAVTALGLAVRFLAISLRPKEKVGSTPGVDRARGPASSPLRTTAMSLAQAQLGRTVQVLPGEPGARAADSWAALPAQGWSASSGPLPALGTAPVLDPVPALGPAPAYAAQFPGWSDAYRAAGFTPLGAPPYGDEIQGGMRGRPYLAADRTPSALAGPDLVGGAGPGPFAGAGPAAPARQPLYEPGYDGPPRYAGAPRGHGDVPQDALSSYPYGPRGHWAPSAPRYPDDHETRPGSDGSQASRAGSPAPRAALSPPPASADRGTGPMRRLETGPLPRAGTGPLPRADGCGQLPRPGTGPMPRGSTGPMPRADSVPHTETGPRTQLGPRTEPRPRADSGPMPRSGTGPLPRPDGGALSHQDIGALPRPDTGPMPRSGTGPPPRAAGRDPLPPASSGSGPGTGTGMTSAQAAGPAPWSNTGPMPRPATGPLTSRADTSMRSTPGTGTGPRPRPGQPMPPANPATGPRTGPLPAAADRPSRKAKPSDPRHREMPGPTGGAT